MKLRLRDVLGRAAERGYTPEEIAPAIVKHLGNGWVSVDVGHPAYPAKKRDGHVPAMSTRDQVNAWLTEMGQPLHLPIKVSPHGPGTELKKLLGKLGITSTPTCSCNKRAQAMDAKGAEWCEENIETICDWLAEESAKRKLPFIRSAGKLLIRMAIRNAKKGNSQ